MIFFGLGWTIIETKYSGKLITVSKTKRAIYSNMHSQIELYSKCVAIGQLEHSLNG